MREALSLIWTAFANLTEAGLLEDVPRSRLGWSGNSSGQPSMTVTPVLRELLDTCLREEAVALSKAIWISLGPKATQGIEWIIQQGALDRNNVLIGLRICRPRYGCRACGTIHQAPAPERPIAKGLASPGLLAHVLIAKYCDHLRLYRQSQIFARHGVEMDRSTLANWVGGACWWLEPLQARLAAHVFGSAKLFADDTPIPVLDPGRGRTKTGRLWVYARDDRPWSGPEPPAAVYLYNPDRKAERPAAHLQGFRGVLQVDGYAGFERPTAPGDIVLAACWAHARRKFYELHEATGSPIAAEALRRIAELYAIEGPHRRGASARALHQRPATHRDDEALA
jgi:transposase